MVAVKRATPYNLDPVFEKAVVTLACSNTEFYERVGQHLDAELFNLASSKLAVRAAQAIFRDIGHGPAKAHLVIQRLRAWMTDGKVRLEDIKNVSEMFDDAEDEELPDIESVVAELAPVLQQRLRDEAVQAAIESFGQKRDLSKAVALEAKAARIGVKGPADAPIVRRLSHVRRESVSWLWRGRIPLGKLTVVDGDPGLGKSTMLSADIAARVSTGAPMPGEPEDHWRAPADVIILSAEDGAGDTIRPRLEAADGDVTSVHVVEASALVFPDDVARLEAMIREHAAKLVVIDPLMAYFGRQVDAHRDQDVRRTLRQLAAMAERTGCAIVVVRHLNKRSDTSAVYRGGGSIGIIGAARSGLLVARDPEDENARILASIKSNLGPPPRSLRFTLENHPGYGCGRVDWRGEVDLTADALVDPAAGDQREGRGAVQVAVEVLQEILQHGPVEAEAAKAEATTAGVSAATLRRARAQLGVRPLKAGMTGPWMWSLPKESA